MNRFDTLAKEWDLHPGRLASAQKTTNKLKSLVAVEGKDILDYGTGTGLIAFDLFEEAKSILAMDNSQGMLDEMNRKIASADITNINTKLHHGDQESFDPESVDLFVTAMTLHHIEKPKTFIQKAATSLKSGGHLVISDLESEDGTFHGNDPDDVKHFGFDKDEIKTWFEEAGLEMVYLETNETIQKHRDFNIFLAVGRRA